MSKIITSAYVELRRYTPNPEIAVAEAADLCYSKEGLKRDISLEEARKMIRRIPKKHKSILEQADYTFYIQGISRACSHQLVRHRIASPAQRSQRYIDERESNHFLPERFVDIMGEEWIQEKLKENKGVYQEILQKYAQRGITGEKANEEARYFLYTSIETKLILKLNASSLLNLLNVRMCNRSQKEVRDVAWKMFSLVYPTAPSIFEKAGPDCAYATCQEEKRSCGLVEEVKRKLDKIKEEQK